MRRAPYAKACTNFTGAAVGTRWGRCALAAGKASPRYSSECRAGLLKIRIHEFRTKQLDHD